MDQQLGIRHAVRRSTSASIRLFEGENELLRRFRAGEPAALTDIYFRCRGAVAAVARRGILLRGESLRYVHRDADRRFEDDIVQEVFMRAFSTSARLRFDETRPYLPYLFQIARNLRVDLARRGYFERPLHAELADGYGGAIEASLPGGSASWHPEHLVDYARARARALRCVAGFDPLCQRLIQLRFVEELSQEQTAQAMALGRGRVRVLERTLLRRIRQRLGPER